MDMSRCFFCTGKLPCLDKPILCSLCSLHHAHTPQQGQAAFYNLCSLMSLSQNSSAGFFSQFGVVTRVRVSRNKRTGKSKHYAFVEFYLAEVAAIAAEAMDGYMMFALKLKVEVVPRSRQHPSLMRGSKKPFKVRLNHVEPCVFQGGARQEAELTFYVHILSTTRKDRMYFGSIWLVKIALHNVFVWKYHAA